MIETRHEKNFFQLSLTNFNVHQVIGLSTDDPNHWYVSGEGVLTVGVEIFENMADLRVKASSIIFDKELQLNNLKRVWRTL